MTPMLAKEAMLCDMAKAVRGYANLTDLVHRLRAAGYTDRQIIDNGKEIVTREKTRKEVMANADRIPERAY